MEQLYTFADPITALPTRIGPRPRTHAALPHIQLEQWPSAEVFDDLMDFCLRLPYVRPKQSRMASPESRALALPDEFAAGPTTAFIDDHEFCHLHPLPEGSIHLTLPNAIRESAVKLGWAEPHPAARVGIMTEALVMVYAPRNSRELGVVLKLISSSYQFARWGAVANLDSGAIME